MICFKPIHDCVQGLLLSTQRSLTGHPLGTTHRVVSEMTKRGVCKSSIIHPHWTIIIASKINENKKFGEQV